MSSDRRKYALVMENPRERLRVTIAQIAEINSVLKQESTIRKTSELFAVLSDPTRVKIILALSTAELCVGDLAYIVGASDSAVSHQLRILRNMDLVDHRREGKLTLYSLSDEHLKTILEQSLAHVSE
jgi:ArsR family transcriptional regulator, lead/cadmium/zinc/bismuth-responsive transcriptional repressor